MINHLLVALGLRPPPTLPPLPVAPRLVVVAPSVRAAEWWLNEQGMTHRDRHVYLVTPDRPERLRGLGDNLEIIWISGPPYPTGKARILSEYVQVIRACHKNVTFEQVWLP